MEKQALISIIVPVYNVVEYLENCVRSVLNQTYATWELLLIDDESTDGSSQLCDKLAANDSRIRVIPSSHGGPGPDTLEVMLNAMYAYDVDVVGCGVFFEYPSRTKTVSYVKSDCVLSREEVLQMIITGQLPSYLWMLLLRRPVVQEPFAELPCYEDYATGYKWISHARRAAMLTTAKYHYVQRQGSILHTARKDKFLLEVLIDRHKYIKSHQLLNETDNRANTVRNMLKLAKDFSRKPVSNEEKVQFVSQIRDVLPKYLPATFKQLGLKRWLRLKLLMRSVQTFVRFV